MKSSSPLTLFPLFQMLAHLTVMPWQRQALVAATDAHNKKENVTTSDSSSTDLSAMVEQPSSQPLIERLTFIAMNTDTNMKLKQASLDFLGALGKTNPSVSVGILAALGG